MFWKLSLCEPTRCEAIHNLIISVRIFLLYVCTVPRHKLDQDRHRPVIGSQASYLRELRGSNLCSETGYPTSFMVLLSLSRKMPRYCLKSGNGRFLLRPFQFTINELRYHLTFCNMGYCLSRTSSAVRHTSSKQHVLYVQRDFRYRGLGSYCRFFL
jgi:ribosomal protein S14